MAATRLHSTLFHFTSTRKAMGHSNFGCLCCCVCTCTGTLYVTSFASFPCHLICLDSLPLFKTESSKFTSIVRNVVHDFTMTVTICFDDQHIQYRSKVSYQSRLVSRKTRIASREMRLSSREMRISSRDTRFSSREIH